MVFLHVRTSTSVENVIFGNFDFFAYNNENLCWNYDLRNFQSFCDWQWESLLKLRSSQLLKFLRLTMLKLWSLQLLKFLWLTIRIFVEVMIFATFEVFAADNEDLCWSYDPRNCWSFCGWQWESLLKLWSLQLLKFLWLTMRIFVEVMIFATFEVFEADNEILR